jgi:acyl-CoA thioesterase
MSAASGGTSDPQSLAEACARSLFAEDRASKGLGMVVETVAPGHAVLRMEVREDMTNGHGICHGGFIFMLASSAFAFACNTYNRVTVAQAAKIDFIRPAARGDILRAQAREISRGGRSGLFDVEVRRADGTLVACFRGNSHSSDKPLLEDPA